MKSFSFHLTALKVESEQIDDNYKQSMYMLNRIKRDCKKYGQREAERFLVHIQEMEQKIHKHQELISKRRSNLTKYLMGIAGINDDFLDLEENLEQTLDLKVSLKHTPMSDLPWIAKAMKNITALSKNISDKLGAFPTQSVDFVNKIQGFRKQFLIGIAATLRRDMTYYSNDRLIMNQIVHSGDLDLNNPYADGSFSFDPIAERDLMNIAAKYRRHSVVDILKDFSSCCKPS